MGMVPMHRRKLMYFFARFIPLKFLGRKKESKKFSFFPGNFASSFSIHELGQCADGEGVRERERKIKIIC